MLPEDEAQKIQQLSVIFPEVREELDRIAQSLEGIASVTAVAPPPELKDRIMGKLRSLKTEAGSEPEPPSDEVPFSPLTIVPTENAAAEPGDQRAVDHKVVPIESKANRYGWLTAASIVGLVLNMGAVIYLASQNRTRNTTIASLSRQVDTLSVRNREQQSKILALGETMLMAESKEYKKIGLEALPGKEQALANVLWNTKTHEVFVSDMSLPKAPDGKQYQLWAIVDGKPVDAGLLSDSDKYRAQRMKVFDKADAFAISIEQKGGSPTPTEVYLMGKNS
jgi:hypothetical protein